MHPLKNTKTPQKPHILFNIKDMKLKLMLDRIQEEDQALNAFGLVLATRFVPLIVAFLLDFIGISSEIIFLIIFSSIYIIYTFITLYFLIKTIKNKKAFAFLIYAFSFWIYEFMANIENITTNLENL
tara:strand:- start:152 stop:532 length:381 start_codon:yes stop_codon:yes gene_type:complete